MKKGFNKAVLLDKLTWIMEDADVKNRPCVFLFITFPALCFFLGFSF